MLQTQLSTANVQIKHTDGYSSETSSGETGTSAILRTVEQQCAAQRVQTRCFRAVLAYLNAPSNGCRVLCHVSTILHAYT
jgi:hypothetical protein